MSQTVGPGIRIKVLERSKFRCERCGVRQMSGLHMSHRQARGMGGAKGKPHDRLSNVNALCAKCHLRFVEREPSLAELEGWKVRRGKVPMAVPIRMWDGWFILDDTGCRQEVMEPIRL